MFDFSIKINNQNELEEEVQKQVRLIDQIKVWSSLREDLFISAIKEGIKYNKVVRGHIPFGVRMDVAINHNFQGNDHFMQFGQEFTQLAGIPVNYTLPNTREGLIERYKDSIQLIKNFDKLDGETLTKLAKRLKNMAQIPTIIYFRGAYHLDEPNYNDKRKDYIHKDIKLHWKTRNNILPFGPDLDKISDIIGKMTKILSDNNVTILVGTDTPNQWIFHGFSVHDEMVEFQKFGISTAKILRSATIDSAKFLREEKSTGSIMIGKKGNVVLLGSNPLIDMNNIRNVEGILLRGKYFNKSDIDNLYQKAKFYAGN
jgi:hypothetical protein